MDKKVLILLAVLLMWGFAIRVYDLSYHSYWMDESYSVLSTMNMERYGIPMFDSDTRYLRHLPFSAVLFVFGRFGYDEWMMRFPSVVFGTLLIAAVFFYSRRVFGEDDAGDYMALIPACFVCFSELFVAWSRQARHYSLFVLLFFVSLYFLMVFVKKPCGRSLLYLTGFTVLAVMTHQFAMVLLIVYFFTFLFYCGRFKGVRVSLPVWALILPAFAYIGQAIVKDVMILDMKMNYTRQYYGFFHEQYFVFLYVSVIGVFLLRRNKGAMALFLGGAVAFFLHSMLVHLMAYRYMLYLTVFLFIFAAPAFFYVARQFRDKRVSLVVMVVILGLAMSHNSVFAPQSKLWLESDTPQPDMRGALNAIDASNDDTVITVYTALTEIYLRKPDYWLAFDFSKMNNTRGWLNDEGMERYTNVTPILDAGQFSEVVSSGHGYVIIDEMSKMRIDREIVSEVEGMKVVFEKDDGFWTKVWVYEFFGE